MKPKTVLVCLLVNDVRYDGHIPAWTRWGKAVVTMNGTTVTRVQFECRKKHVRTRLVELEVHPMTDRSRV